MKILVLNCGSSSIKYALYNMDDKSVMTSGGAERVGLDGAFVKVKLANGEKKQIMHDIPEHTEGVKFIFSLLTDPEIGVIKSLDEIDAVGHRMVHGGEKFNKSVVLNDEVLKAFEECSDLAPLHNPANLKGVNAVKELMPGLPQVGVFDTAFHQTMPAKAYMYAIPYELYEKYGVRRYGFHGTSHKFVAEKAAKMIGRDWNDLKIISCHLGSGASICAIDHGKSFDTTMGMTPLEGLIMGSRPGDVDPGVIEFIIKKEIVENGKDWKDITKILNKQSGLVGISGGKQDMRDIRAGRDAGDVRCTYAFDMFAQRVKRYIGGYMAEMGGCDLLLFTGGIGENAWFMRRPILENMECLGIKVDFSKNDNVMGEDIVLSTPDSKMAVVVVTTDEEYVIASDTYALVTK